MKPYQSILLTILLCSGTYYLLDRRIKVFEQQDHYIFSLETVKMIWTDGRNYGDANCFRPKPSASKIDSLVNARFIPKQKPRNMYIENLIEDIGAVLIVVLLMWALIALYKAVLKREKRNKHKPFKMI